MKIPKEVMLTALFSTFIGGCILEDEPRHIDADSDDFIQSDQEFRGCPAQGHVILNGHAPVFTSAAAGCAVHGGIALQLSAQHINNETIRFIVTKPDNSPWMQSATLSLYVGTGPSCGHPPNVLKAVSSVNVGASKQYIELVVDPYDAEWSMGEVKQFWVGKSEGGYPAARATDTISIKRTCRP